MRNKAGLSQAELASIVGVSQSAIAKYEARTQVPSYTIATKIFQVLLENVVVNEPTLEEIMIEEIMFLREDDRLETAIQVMKEYSISQVPIKSNTDKVIGTINEAKILDLLSQYHSLEQFKREEIGSIMDDPLPIVPGSTKITEVSQILKRFGGVLVTTMGRIDGIVTKSDLLTV